MVSPLISPAPSSVASGNVRPSASLYAVPMSSTALSTKVLLDAGGLPAKHVTAPLPVYAASTPNIVPVISEQNTPFIAAAVIGLAPMFPVITEALLPVFVIPVFVRITKLLSLTVRRSTGARAAATAVPVVKFHTKGAANALPARSFAPVVIVAVNGVLGARLLAGVKVAVVPR